MKPVRGPQMTMLWRIVLFLTAFIVALVLQMGISHYQSRYVIDPLETRTENIQSISQFLNEVEGCMTALENYRWDYGDASSLIEAIRDHQGTSAAYLQNIESDIRRVSEEQYLLSNAAHTTYGTLTVVLDEIVDELLAGNTDSASQIYYDRAEPCGAYLRQYTQQLLEQALLDNQDAHDSLKMLSIRLNYFQTFTVFLCVLLGGIVVISLIRLLRSVLHMARASEAISRGEFDIPDVDESQRDEIGLMAKAFNEMKRSMKRQVELLNEKNEMERELHVKETEALALQNLMEREKLQQLRSQINPHFLFNTLNLIMYTAQQEGAGRTQTLIGSLSRLFRNALGSNEIQVPLSREVHLVDEFYSLYHARFGDRIRMKWNISPEVDLTETVIPSFILQPLVENAFRHGLSPKAEGGCVDILIRTEGKRLLIQVADNGVGMEPEVLERLRKNLRNTPTTGEHIGVYNVAARMRLWSRENSMDIQSESGKGTTVTLQMPLVVLGEEEEDTDD